MKCISDYPLFKMYCVREIRECLYPPQLKKNNKSMPISVYVLIKLYFCSDNFPGNPVLFFTEAFALF